MGETKTSTSRTVLNESEKDKEDDQQLHRRIESCFIKI